MSCKKNCFKFFSFLLIALLLMFMLTACKRNSKEQEDMAGPGDNTSQNNAYEDSNQDNDLTPGQTGDNLNSATSGETQSSTEGQTNETNTNQNGDGNTDTNGTNNNGMNNNDPGTVGNVIDDAGGGVGDVINDAGNTVKDVADDIGKGL